MKKAVLVISVLITNLALGYEIKSPEEETVGISEAELVWINKLSQDLEEEKIREIFNKLVKDIQPKTAGWLFDRKLGRKYFYFEGISRSKLNGRLADEETGFLIDDNYKKFITEKRRKKLADQKQQ